MVEKVRIIDIDYGEVFQRYWIDLNNGEGAFEYL